MKHSIFLDLMRRKQTSEAKKRMKQLAEDYGCKKIYDLNYCGDHNRNHLCDLYYPAGSEKKKLPVILEVHGGGFVTGSKIVNESHGLFYASHGYKVVNINYTLHPEATFIDEIRELFHAVHWIKSHSEQYAMDSEHICVSGDSAGGFLVLLLAAVQSSPELQLYYQIEPLKNGFCGIAASCPCIDLRTILNSGKKIWKLKPPEIGSPGVFSARYSVPCGQQSFSKCQISLLYWSIVLSEEK